MNPSPQSPLEKPTPETSHHQNPSAKNILLRCHSKNIPIGEEFHQTQVPDLIGTQQFCQNKMMFVKSVQQYKKNCLFRTRALPQIQVQEYLSFVDQYLEEKDPECFSQGGVSRERTHSQALQHLHRCGYNIHRAKFYIVFPYYYAYNNISSERLDQLTDEQIDAKINKHLEGLRSNKNKDYERWLNTIETIIKNKVMLAKLQALMEQSKPNKFEVPEHIREQVDRATRLGKDLKKMLAQGRYPLSQLQSRRDALKEEKIITNEMINFVDMVGRAEEWIKKVDEYESQNFEKDEATGVYKLRRVWGQSHNNDNMGRPADNLEYINGSERNSKNEKNNYNEVEEGCNHDIITSNDNNTNSNNKGVGSIQNTTNNNWIDEVLAYNNNNQEVLNYQNGQGNQENGIHNKTNKKTTQMTPLKNKKSALSSQMEIEEPPLLSHQKQNSFQPRTNSKSKNKKLEYKQLYMMVQEYNSLPLIHPTFEETIKKLYDDTNAIIQKVPQFVKTAKTRTSNPSKCTLSAIMILIKEIEAHPVQHEQFDIFVAQVSDTLELVERVNMFLEDERSEKSSKTLNSYLKLTLDLPIVTNITHKLEQAVEYSTYIQKIRKDIVNPNKFEQTQELLQSCRKKGFITVELEAFEEKLELYRGWYDSLKTLSAQKEEPQPSQRGSKSKNPSSFNYRQLVRANYEMTCNLIDESRLRSQLALAISQLSAEPESIALCDKKLREVDVFKSEIINILNEGSPDLNKMIDIVQQVIKGSIRFPEISLLLMTIRRHFKSIAKMWYFLDEYKYVEVTPEWFFKDENAYEAVLAHLCTKKQIKDLSETHAKQLLQECRVGPFPANIKQWQCFQEFMNESVEWEVKTRQFVALFEEGRDQATHELLDELIEASHNVMADRLLVNKLSDIGQIIKWQNTIQNKIAKSGIVTTLDQKIIQSIDVLVQEVGDLSSVIFNDEMPRQKIKQLSLSYLLKNRFVIHTILQSISQLNLEKTQKLSELVKLNKEIEKMNSNLETPNAKLQRLCKYMSSQIALGEAWKEEYTTIRKADRRKTKHDDNIEIPQQNQNHKELEAHKPEPAQNQKVSKDIRTIEFNYYFKLPLLIGSFKKACKLKIPLQELNKLKNTLEDCLSFTKQVKLLQKKQKLTVSELTTCQQEGNRLNIFTIQSWRISRRSKYISTWVSLADNLIASMPILQYEQLLKSIPNGAARTEIVNGSANKHNQVGEPSLLKEPQSICKKPSYAGENKNNAVNIHTSTIYNGPSVVNASSVANTQTNPNPPLQKRKRKQNTFYNNSQITLLTEDMFASKTKKKKAKEAVENATNAPANIAPEPPVTPPPVIKKKKEEQPVTHAEPPIPSLTQQQLVVSTITTTVPVSKKQNKSDIIKLQIQQYLEEPSIYCICRMGLLNECSVMIGCEVCQRWFHAQCVGIRKSYAKTMGPYVCIACIRRGELEKPQYQTKYFYWESHTRITEDEFQNFLKEGRQLNMVIPQLSKLENVYQKIVQWKKDCSKIVLKLWSRKDAFTYEAQMREEKDELFDLYLQSFWLPTIHLETDLLACLLRRYDPVDGDRS